MPPLARALMALLALSAAAPARAGESACWLDEGVVVIPAVVAGEAGDYILDTGAPTTQLHETRAQAAGFADRTLAAEVRFAGLFLRDRPISVVDLDARTFDFPTPIAGVIGADILSAYVVDVSFAPCRVGVWPRGHAPRFRAGRALPMTLAADGRPMVRAAISDGPSARQGAFVLATGSDTAVRVAGDQAGVPGLVKAQDLAPYGSARARLRALSAFGELWENLAGGLIPRASLPPEALGELGVPILGDWRVRFDFPARRVQLAP